MPVNYKDFTVQVEKQMDDACAQWLIEAANEIRSQAQRNCNPENDFYTQLKGSYRADVEEDKGKAEVGSPLEAAFWEEWGTGEYAAHGDGRKGWWVYIKGAASQGGGKAYATKEEAEEAADFLRKVKHLDAVVTNGRQPNYTLEKAFDQKKNVCIDRLNQILRERMDGGNE